MQFRISLKQAWTALILFAGIVPVTIVAILYGQQIYQNELSSALAIEHHANEMLRSQFEAEIKRYKTLLKNKSEPLALLVDHADEPDALAGMNAQLKVILERQLPKFEWDDYGVGSESNQHYIIDRQGALVTDIQGSNYRVGDSMTHLDIVRSGLANKKWDAMVSYTGISNETVFGSYAIIPSLNWTLVSEVLATSITLPIWEVLFKIILGTMFGIIFFGWLALYLANKTIKPVELACDAIDHVAKGNFQYRLEPSEIKELDTLSTGFNTMVEARETVEQGLRESQHKLADSEAKFRGILESAVDGILLIDARGEIVLANPAILKMTGYTNETLIGQSVEILVPKRFHNHGDLRQVYSRQPRSRPMTSELDLGLRRKDGGEMPVYISLSPVETGNGTFVTAMVQDITELKWAEGKITYQAHFDGLTQLPNRILSLDRLTQLISEAERSSKFVAVLFLDLDDFKKVNDSLGHDTGERLLIEVARRLNSLVRGRDTVGRIGGDEFVVLLGNLADAADARPVVENLINLFRNVFRIEGRQLLVTASVGISVFPEDADNATGLLQQADSAMYHSKALGGNTYSYYTGEMSEDVSRQLALEEKIHGALERGEFEVFYQAKLDLNSGKIMGAEALLRWHNPVLGHIPPTDFIPIAEQTGLITPIGKHVLTQALQATRQWRQDLDKAFCLAVNLSPRQFREPGLVSFIEQELSKFDIPARHLELEITEGVLLSGDGYITDALNTLSKLGVGIAMDDFGTGYSSLSYLRKFPFTVLKVDRSFVSGITIDKADRELTRAAIAMAHSLQLKVVAEGIESEEQLSTLKEMGCDLGQGYLFAKPMSGGDFTKMLEQSVSEYAVSSS